MIYHKYLLNASILQKNNQFLFISKGLSINQSKKNIKDIILNKVYNSDIISRLLIIKYVIFHRCRWIVALKDGEDNCNKYDYRDVTSRLKIVKTNLIIITVGTLPNRLNIKSICDNASLDGFGLLVEISTNAQNIDKAFTKVSKIFRGELHVESL